MIKKSNVRENTNLCLRPNVLRSGDDSRKSWFDPRLWFVLRIDLCKFMAWFVSLTRTQEIKNIKKLRKWQKLKFMQKMCRMDFWKRKILKFWQSHSSCDEWLHRWNLHWCSQYGCSRWLSVVLDWGNRCFWSAGTVDFRLTPGGVLHEFLVVGNQFFDSWNVFGEFFGLER